MTPNNRGARLVQRATMPRIRSAFVLPVPALAFALAIVVPTLAAAQEGPATRHLRERHEGVMQTLRDDPAGAARDTEVGAVIDDLIDYEAMSRAALAAHWDAMTAEQQTEFVSLLRELTRIRYLSGIEDILEYDVEYLREADVTGGRLVSTSARSRTERRAEPIEVAYSMHAVGGVWRVFDVTTDGVSMVANYRRQFHSIIAEHGIDGLLQRMRDRRDRETHR